MRRFPDKMLAPKKLQSVYKKHKIRKKKIRNTKILTDVQRRKIRFLVPEVREKLDAYRNDGFRIIYCDEMCVTKSTMPTHEYSLKNQEIKIDFK